MRYNLKLAAHGAEDGDERVDVVIAPLLHIVYRSLAEIGDIADLLLAPA